MTLNSDKRDIAVNALAFGIALAEVLPSHLHRPLLVSDATDLFEQLGGDEKKLIARARRHVSKQLQPVKVSVSTL